MKNILNKLSVNDTVSSIYKIYVYILSSTKQYVARTDMKSACFESV